jgi:hypothetical protein
LIDPKTAALWASEEVQEVMQDSPVVEAQAEEVQQDPPHVILRKKMKVMLEIQNELNSSKNTNWRLSQHNYEDAIMIETAEMFDQMNWKWWKANPNPVDWNQVKLELIDVWHFALCRVIVQQGIDDGSFELAEIFYDHDFAIQDRLAEEDGEYDETGRYFTPNINQEEVKASVRELMQGVMHDNVEEAVGHTALRSLSYLYDILGVMESLYMPVDALYQLYIGKVELNRLRWANGYGTTYVKNWHGKEDNVRLIEIMNKLNPDDQNFRMQVREALENAYESVKVNAQAEALEERMKDRPGE